MFAKSKQPKIKQPNIQTKQSIPQKPTDGQPESTSQDTDNPGKPKRLTARREIQITTWTFVLLFLGMIGYLSYFTATSEEEMFNNSYNSRQQILLSRNYRGSILSENGEVLAETIVDEEQNESRIYPYEELFSHIVGYTGKGRSGVEAIANYYLIHSNTTLSNKAANDAAGVKNPGDTVYTTLNVKLQQVADQELNVYQGAIVVTEVATGKVLAMVSHPDFDPNEIEDIWDELVEDDSSSVLVNRATQGLYPPGSTFKILTALEYIREHPDTYQDYRYACNGTHKYGEYSINCYHGINHGSVDLMLSFAKSCNSSFANIGMGLDRDAFTDTLNSLMFQQDLSLSMSVATSSVSASADVSDWEMMQTSIGQGKTQITPIHLNMITAAIANGGIMNKPYVVERVENDAGRLIKSFRTGSYGRVMSQEEANILTGLMIDVVEEGTASKLKGLDYTAAGKTGSAEYNNIKGESHAWFTGFAPAENPEVCVTIIVEGAGSGGDYAVPIARRLFDAYFAEK